MAIFIFMSLLLTIGLAVRGHEMVDGDYFGTSRAFIIEDIISLSIAGFGMIGIWGYATNKAFFRRVLWKAFLLVSILTAPFVPFISPKYQMFAHEHGAVAMWTAYGIATILALPAFWGWYSYAYRKDQVWARDAT